MSFVRGPDPSNEHVEDVALSVLGATMVFILLQVLVMVAWALIRLLLPALGILTPEGADVLSKVVVMLAEAALIYSLVRMIRGNARSHGPMESNDHVIAEPSSLERRLEWMMITGAVCAVCCSLLMGAGPVGARIALAVIEAFAALFLLVVIVTRWLMTRRVSHMAIVSLGFILWSLWLATQSSAS